MPSPFPGMDPYLEVASRWPDVHQRLITYIADALQPEVRPRYHARMGERVYVFNPFRGVAPDVFLLGPPRPDIRQVRVREVVAAYQRNFSPAVAPDTVAATAAREADVPLRFRIPRIELREPFVELLHSDGEVVTVVEVLSPANKTPCEGHRQYMQKQEQLLNSPVHLVEIDLLSTGLRTMTFYLEGAWQIPEHRYLVNVRRGPDDTVEVYPIPLARRLPRISVPLREPDPDVVLDLQAVFDRAYDNGGYADLIDHRLGPPVPLSEAEAAWADELLRSKGIRV